MINNKKSGFTLIELLVVISIISLLSSTVVASVRTARIKAHNAIRLHNFHTLQISLELYHDDYGIYPKTFEPGEAFLNTYWPPGVRSECFTNPTDWIPGLVPNYIPILPTDPAIDCIIAPSTAHSWYYASDGVNYKLMTHMINAPMSTLLDPFWDGGSDECAQDGSETDHYAIWSENQTPDLPPECWAL